MVHFVLLLIFCSDFLFQYKLDAKDTKISAHADYLNELPSKEQLLFDQSIDLNNTPEQNETQNRRKYTCDFELGLCTFLMNNRNNKENWKIGRGKMNSEDTGPSIDHTLGTANGSYLFVNVSAAKTSEVQLQTVVLKSAYCVRFFYHMYGAAVGNLNVFTQSVDNVNDTKKYFSRSKTQGDRWKETFFSVTESGSMKLKGYRVIFSARHITYSSVKGDIALDDIELTPGKCADTKTDVRKLCTFDDYDCGYTETQNSSLNWKWKTPFKLNSNFPLMPSIDHTLGSDVGGYWFSGVNSRTLDKPKSGVQEAILSSPVYAKPNTPLNCLHFYYYIDGDGSSWLWGKIREAYIQAHINFPNSKDGRLWLITKAKNVTNHRQWTYAEAKADITADFQFQFTAGFDSPVEALVAIDDIKLVSGNCREAGSCDFEEDKCTWTDGEGQYNWIRKNGRSSINSEIGPNSDHTLQTLDGNYVVFSTNFKNASSEANLESELFPPSEEPMCLSFFYHMAGDGDLGTLKVLRKEENVTMSTLWLMTGHQGNIWKKGMVALNPSVLHNQVVFRGITGKGKGYMALDDIRIINGEKCDQAPPEADPSFEAISRLTCTFDNNSLCYWIQDTTTLSWKFGNGTLIDSTGPEQPLSGSGHYIYVNSYDGMQSNNQKVARLQSAVVSSFHHKAACFSFYYHMFGAHVGELRVYVVPMQDKKTPLGKQVIWRKRGTQPDKWLQFTDSLNITEGDYRLEIEAEGGDGFAGDIAIDEISLSLGACPDVAMCDFESSLCGWTIEDSQEAKFSWRRSMGLKKGPKQDHTTNTNFGYYLQAFADDGAQAEEKTSLVSPGYGSRWGPHCVTFWYYRPGKSVGKISVLTRSQSKETLKWSAAKDVGKYWHYGQVTIDERRSLRIIFQAEKGNRDDYHMALDDILIKNRKCESSAECNFNNDYCSYSNSDSADFAWLLGTGRIVNTELVDPPPVDSSIENGMYVYADMTSPILKENSKAILNSEILEMPDTEVSCLRFFYHKNGNDSSTFTVGKSTLDNTKKEVSYISTELVILTNNTGKGWIEQSVNVDGVRGTSYQIYFQATRGSGARSFIAIDNISLRDGQCQTPTTEPPVTVTDMPLTSVSCDFDNGKFCSWRVQETKLKWQISVPIRSKDYMPKFDHTKGNYLGRYAYLKGDDVAAKEGSILSVSTPREWDVNFCFSFWYFMNVEGESSLKVYAENLESWSKTYKTYWRKEGNYGYRWRHAYVQIKSSLFSPKLRIDGKVKTGVIAIDDLAAKAGKCPPAKMYTFDDADDMSDFTQDSKNLVDWDIKTGEDIGTLSRMPDHTTQSMQGGYLYIGFNETALGSSQRSRIYSPKREPSPVTSCVTFYYHIYNISKLSLNTYLSTDNGLSDPQWSVTIGQGLLWHGARFPVVSKSVSWQVVFEVNVGSRGYGQVAIDDISISDGPCPDQGFCDFESEDCLWENARPPYDSSKSIGKAPFGGQNADVTTDLLKDDFDWKRHIAEDYFGPPKDHTLGSPQGFYLLLDTRYVKPNEKAVYVSERLRTTSSVCLKLWYSIPNYRNGASLLVYSSGDFKKADQGKLIRGTTNEVWTEALVTVTPPMTADLPFTDFWIFLSGVAGNHTLGSIAIDDISIKDGVCEVLECDCGKNSIECYFDRRNKKVCVCQSGFASANGTCLECDCGPDSLGCDFDRFGRKSCQCIDRYSGRFGTCEECNCGISGKNCSFSLRGEKECICEDNYSMKYSSQRCESCYCGRQTASCRFSRSGGKICECMPGYGVKNGTCVETCLRDIDCAKGRICRKEGNASFCDCPPNFVGEWCEINLLCYRLQPLCDTLGAKCVARNSTAICKCPPGKSINAISGVCEEVCIPNRCLNGKCEETEEGFYTCRCDAGFTGMRCENRISIKTCTEFLWIIFVTFIALTIVFFCGIFYVRSRGRK